MSNFTRDTSGPVAVTLIDECELAVAGLRVLLEPFADRVALVDHREAVASPGSVDVVLYEPRDRTPALASQLQSLTEGGAGTTVAYSWAPLDDEPVADGVVRLSKTLTASQLVVAIEEVVSGRHPGLTAAPPAPRPAVAAKPVTDPDVDRLTNREHDVLTLIAQGLPNQIIAARLGLSLNSVKTYIRTAYRKIGAERRTQAVLWGLDHGLARDPRTAATADA